MTSCSQAAEDERLAGQPGDRLASPPRHRCWCPALWCWKSVYSTGANPELGRSGTYLPNSAEPRALDMAHPQHGLLPALHQEARLEMFCQHTLCFLKCPSPAAWSTAGEERMHWLGGFLAQGVCAGPLCCSLAEHRPLRCRTSPALAHGPGMTAYGEMPLNQHSRASLPAPPRVAGSHRAPRCSSCVTIAIA